MIYNEILDEYKANYYIDKEKIKLNWKNEFTTDENPFLGDNDLKVKEESYDKIIYKATINNEEIYFVIGKIYSKINYK